MSATEIGGNTTNILNCNFWKWIYTLAHQTIYYIWATNLLPINSISWSSLLEKCKENWCRPKYITSFPYLVLKEASHKPLNVAAAKKYFPSVFIIDATCVDECFSFHVITANSVFYTKLSLPRGLVQPPSFSVLPNKCFERNRHFIFIISTIILWWC